MRFLDMLLGPEQEPEKLWDYSGINPTTLQPLLVNGQILLADNGGGLLALPTLFRGIQILTDTAGALPWQAIRGGHQASQARWADPEEVDPQPIILVKPSPFHTRNEVVRKIVYHLILRGNAYLWLTGHDEAGRPTVAVPINPDEVSVVFRQDKSGSSSIVKVYTWRHQVMTEGFDLLHIHLEELPGSPTGLGPLDAARRTLGYALDADSFGGEFFQGSATPAGVLNHPGRLDKTEADTLRVQWEEAHALGRGTAVLSGGIEYNPISITPEQAQFIATRAFNNQQIATLLGIPQHLLNAGQPQGTASSLTYANLAMVMEELYRMTLSPVYLTRIEESFQRLLPRGQSVRFLTQELLRTDDAARWAAEKIALEANILTNDEVRELEGRAPLPPSELEDTNEDGNVSADDAEGDSGDGVGVSSGDAVRRDDQEG